MLLIRGLRSLGQGAMVVDLTLYLKQLHWSGAAIGGVTSAAGLVGAALILGVGVLSDRIGRRPFLLIYEMMTLVAAIAACFTVKGFVLVLAIVLAGFGRGQSGAAGPFSPAEQAWLARHVNQSSRGPVFSLNNAVGFVGMAIGSMIGGVPDIIQSASPIARYRPVFAMVAVISLFCTFLLLRLREDGTATEASTAPARVGEAPALSAKVDERPAAARVRDTSIPKDSGAPEAQQDRQIRARENVAMLKLASVNVLNGLAVGLTGPLIAYWFSVRYHVGTAAIGTTLAIGFLMTGATSLFNGWLAGRMGMVRSVTWMRVIGSSLMLALPFMPNFAAASVLYVVRGAINRGTQGNRSALSASLTRDSRRGLATSVNALSMRLPSSIGPTISGYLFDAGWLNLPLVLTAVLQLANAALYQWIFGSYDGRSSRAKGEAH